MPPKNVTTARELIYWEYAKLIAGSAVGDRKNRPFSMYMFKKLQAGKLHPSTILKENKLLVEEKDAQGVVKYRLSNVARISTKPLLEGHH